MWRACRGVVRLVLIASVFIAGPFHPLGGGFGAQHAVAGQDGRPGHWKSTPGGAKHGRGYSSPVPDVVDFLNRTLDAVFGEPRGGGPVYDPGEAAGARVQQDSFPQRARGPAGPETMAQIPIPRPADDLGAGVPGAAEEEWLIAAVTAPAALDAGRFSPGDPRSAVVIDAAIADPAVTARSAPAVLPGAATGAALAISPSSAAAPADAVAAAPSETAGAAAPAGTGEGLPGSTTDAAVGDVSALLAALLIEPVVHAAVIAAHVTGLIAGMLAGGMQGGQRDELATVAIYAFAALLAAMAAFRVARRRVRVESGTVPVAVLSNRIRWRLVRLRGRVAGSVSAARRHVAGIGSTACQHVVGIGIAACRQIAGIGSAARRHAAGMGSAACRQTVGVGSAVARAFGAAIRRFRTGTAEQFRAACGFVRYRLWPAARDAVVGLAEILSGKILPAAWSAASETAGFLFLRVIPAIRDHVIWPAGAAAYQIFAGARVGIAQLAEAAMVRLRSRHARPSPPAHVVQLRVPAQRPRLSEDEVLRAIRETIEGLAAESRARRASALTDGAPEVSR